MRAGIRLTIYHKLIALIIALMVAVVAGLTFYLSSQQIDAMSAALRSKAATYGSVMANQVTSAVAFSDRETAREVLQSIDADSEVASVVLHGESGGSLYARGKVTPGIVTSDASATPRVVDIGTRIAAVTLVASLEGPRGVLVIELSTESLNAARDRVRWLAFLTGIAAIAAGAIAAWWIARRLALRLRAIANVASAVAGGDLTQQPIADRQRDEIGTLAAAFNAMLAQIQQLIAHIQELARKEQDRLENLVAVRTAELDQRNAEMRLVFDEVDQGLFMVDLDGSLASERSAAVERLLGPVPASGSLHDYVRAFAPASADWFALQWDMLREGVLPHELCLDQLPSRFEVGSRHLELHYKLTDASKQVRVLVVISDVSARVQRQRAERDERETASLVSRMLRGRAGFLAFHAEANQYIATITAGPHGDAAFRRTVHTLKGIASLEGIDSIVDHCHALETALAEADEVGALAACRTIGARWELVTSKLAPMLAAAADRIDLVRGDLDRIETALRRGGSTAELLAIVDGWRHERIEPRLQRFADDAHALAARLGKAPIEVKVEVGDDLRLPSERAAEFWSSFSHAIRNAIDHGLEPPHERGPAGKPEIAVLTLRAARRGDQIIVELHDNGCGIDWDRVAECARRRGMSADSHADLVSALFQEGFTTRDTATEVSGRGIGLSALRHACTASGGEVTITSRRGAGTTLRFSWPCFPASPDALQIAG